MTSSTHHEAERIYETKIRVEAGGAVIVESFG